MGRCCLSRPTLMMRSWLQRTRWRSPKHPYNATTRRPKAKHECCRWMATGATVASCAEAVGWPSPRKHSLNPECPDRRSLTCPARPSASLRLTFEAPPWCTTSRPGCCAPFAARVDTSRSRIKKRRRSAIPAYKSGYYSATCKRPSGSRSDRRASGQPAERRPANGARPRRIVQICDFTTLRRRLGELSLQHFPQDIGHFHAPRRALCLDPGVQFERDIERETGIEHALVQRDRQNRDIELGQGACHVAADRRICDFTINHKCDFEVCRDNKVKPLNATSTKM